MGVPILILGASGSGKSTSLRNFEPNEVGVFNIASKPLPFRKKLKLINGNNYELIKQTLSKNSLKSYVIDDTQYLMAFEQLGRAKEKSFDKYIDIGLHFTDLVQHVVLATSPDTLVYFLHHVEHTDDGRIKAKTVGKLIDNWLTLEGMFSIVLLAETDGKEHWFTTQSNGFTTAKSPMDMFPARIDNDLKAVDAAIRDYWFGGEDDSAN